jgi:ribokinase
VAAARLGAQVALIGRIGDDAFGEEILAALVHEGIDVREVRAVDGASSGVGFVSVDERRTGAARAIAQASTLLLQLEVPVPAVEAATLRAHASGRRVVLNAAPAQTLPLSLLESVDVLVANRVEAARMTGASPDEPAEGLAERLLALGPGLAVLTLGAEGALACRDGETHFQSAFAVEVVDAVGAGDAFCATLAIALDDDLPIAAALRFACAAGALATTRSGAQPALPQRAAVESLAAGGLEIV